MCWKVFLNTWNFEETKPRGGAKWKEVRSLEQRDCSLLLYKLYSPPLLSFIFSFPLPFLSTATHGKISLPTHSLIWLQPHHRSTTASNHVAWILKYYKTNFILFLINWSFGVFCQSNKKLTQTTTYEKWETRVAMSFAPENLEVRSLIETTHSRKIISIIQFDDSTNQHSSQKSE